MVGPDAYNSTCRNAPTRATKTIGDLEVSDFTLSNAEIKAFGSVNRLFGIYWVTVMLTYRETVSTFVGPKWTVSSRHHQMELR